MRTQQVSSRSPGLGLIGAKTVQRALKTTVSGRSVAPNAAADMFIVPLAPPGLSSASRSSLYPTDRIAERVEAFAAAGSAARRVAVPGASP